MRFIKNFQIIREEFPFFSQFFTICIYLRGIGYSTEPGRQAHTGSGWLRYAAKILYEIMLAGFLCLTKPAFMRRPWRITPCPAVPGWAFLCFVGIILQYLGSFAIRPPEPVCACRPGSSRYGSIYLLVALPTAVAVGSLCACWLFFYAFPSAAAAGSLWPSPASHRVSS